MEFEVIYNEFAARVYRLCLGYANDEDWAKDLTQETFLAVWKNLKKFRSESSVGTWIYRIAVNTCLRQIEKNKKIKKVPLHDDLKHESPENTNSEKLNLLHSCIASLDKTDRLLISMVLDEVPYNEIADVFGISEGNLRVKIHRVKKILMRKVKENE
jgi:RNA polymerase sigma-70 factor, ECF subfamily